MTMYRSRIPKCPLSSKLTKESLENVPPPVEKKMELPIPALKTPSRFEKSYSTSSTGCFSENAKRKSKRRSKTLSTVKENSPLSKAKVKLVPNVKRSKRPGWDINGRLKDMEIINVNLKEKLETFTERIVALEKDKHQLDQDAKVKSVQSEEATVAIEKLKKDIRDRTETLTAELKEKDAKILALQSLCDPLVNENMLLKSELLSLKLCVSTLTNSVPMLQTQLETTKLLLIQAHDKCEKQETVVQSLSDENAKLIESVTEQEAISKELHILIQTLKS